MTTIIEERDCIRYSLLDAEDFDEVAQLVALVFTDGSEPITRTLPVEAGDFIHLVKAFGPKFMSEGLSVVARDTATNKVVAAQLNDDMGTQPPDLKDVHNWGAPVLALLDELDSRYFGDQIIEPNGYAHFFFTAVLPQYRERGISSRLLELSLAIASCRGYTKATAEATGLVSQHVLAAEGFEPRVEIPYATFQYDGNAPFQDIEDHPSALLMDKALPVDHKQWHDRISIPECAILTPRAGATENMTGAATYAQDGLS
jgi:GNAT superfamily N-acetyltransferase